MALDDATGNSKWYAACLMRTMPSTWILMGTCTILNEIGENEGELSRLKCE